MEIWLLGRESARLAKGEVEIVLRHRALLSVLSVARNKGELKQFARPQESVAHVCSARLLTTFSSQ